jgi:hypothetical protein
VSRQILSRGRRRRKGRGFVSARCQRRIWKAEYPSGHRYLRVWRRFRGGKVAAGRVAVMARSIAARKLWSIAISLSRDQQAVVGIAAVAQLGAAKLARAGHGDSSLASERGTGCTTGLAATNECLPRSNKSRTGAKLHRCEPYRQRDA